MIKKLILSAFMLVVCASFAAAQTAGDFNKFEVFGGYSNNQVDVGLGDSNNSSNNGFEDFFNDRESFNGFNAAVTGNVNRYVGVRGDVSGHYKSFRFRVPAVGTTPATDFKVDSSVYNVLGGVQFKDNSREGSRVRPFGFAQIGVAVNRSDVDESFFSSSFCRQPGVDCRDLDDDDSEAGFAAAIGGGLDVRVHPRVDIRAIQVDYNPNRVGGSTQHNFRFGVGVVFR